MLMNMKDLLAVAQKNHFAIPAFNIGSDQLLKVVMKKVKELNSPVILEMMCLYVSIWITGIPMKQQYAPSVQV